MSRLPRRAAALLMAALSLSRSAPAQPGLARHDPSRVLAAEPAPRPEYLRARDEPRFGTRLVSIAGDPGAATVPVTGVWGRDARHTYSKQQPWSSDGSLMVIENRDGGSPSKLFLDGERYVPRLAPCAGAALWDCRWHPSPAHPHEMINVDKSGTELSWIDVTTCTKTRRWRLPFRVTGLGDGEGNPSDDGRFVCLGNQNAMFVVDMDPQPPYPPYPAVRIGPVYTFPPCSLSVDSPADCRIGNLSVSASGRFVDVKYGTSTDSTEDAHRIYEVDPATLALRVHPMADGSTRCGSFAARPNGWIFPLKHADLAIDPFDHDEDVIVGGRSCPGSTLGHVVKVRLRDGRVTALTSPDHEAAVMHVSTRNLRRPGWAYVSYYRQPGRRFSDEIVAVRLDGQAVERWARMHSATSGCYRCEPQPAPSPDGRRVVFATNWMVDCDDGCGDPAVIRDVVVEASDVPVMARSAPPSRGTAPRRGAGHGRRRRGHHP